jgi:hypothetical protein
MYSRLTQLWVVVMIDVVLDTTVLKSYLGIDSVYNKKGAWRMDLLSSLTAVMTTLIGFVSGWGLFELTDWRRRTSEQRELRSALVAELQNAEVLASYTVVKYARYFQGKAKVALVAHEIRWFQTVGRSQMEAAGVVSNLPQTPPAFETLGDEQLVDLFSQIDETIGSKLIFPIVESVLAGKTSGLNAQQIAALSMVHWHAHLLSQNADAMREFLHMSYTVTDETNHPRVIKNHEKQCASYALRAEVLLGVIRRALQLLRS